MESGEHTWDQADTSHCSFLCLWQRLSRQTSWVRGLGSEVQAVSCSNWARAEGLVLLQTTALFLHPFPQVREHCTKRVSEENFQQRRSAMCGPATAPSQPTWLPLPRAQCSKQVGSFESCRLGE